MTEPIVLADSEEYGCYFVKLAESHDVDYTGSASELTTATLTQGGAKLRRISSQKKTKEFSLTNEALDALIVARTNFKAAQEAKAKAEEERLAGIVDEAYALAGEHIKIIAENDTWTILCPIARFESGTIRNAEYLLSNVKAINKRYRHLWNRAPRKITTSPTGGDAA